MAKLKLILTSIGVLIALGLLWQFVLPNFRTSNAFLQITTGDLESKVFLDDKLLGKTPYQGEKLEIGDHTLRLETKLLDPFNKTVTFSTSITLTPQALTAINYEFGPNDLVSSGDIRTFMVGDGLSIITAPSGAAVWLDGEIVGKSPISLNPNQGVHKLKITNEDYVSRELEINIEEDLRLVVEVFLSIDPFSKEPKKLTDPKLEIYDLSSNNDELLSNPKSWSEAVFFFEREVKINFDVVIDKNGNLYYKTKSEWDKKIKAGRTVVIGYLGDSADKTLSNAANKTLEQINTKSKLTKKTPAKKEVQILSTPTGTLNVRSGPSLSYSILTKVKPDEKYTLLEEKSDWYKINVNGTKGWVSAQYAKVI